MVFIRGRQQFSHPTYTLTYLPRETYIHVPKPVLKFYLSWGGVTLGKTVCINMSTRKLIGRMSRRSPGESHPLYFSPIDVLTCGETTPTWAVRNLGGGRKRQSLWQKTHIVNFKLQGAYWKRFGKSSLSIVYSKCEDHLI